MTIQRVLLLSAILVLGCGGLFAEAASPTGLTADHLRCEYLADPLGIDVAQPRLSWTVASGERGQRQTAYQLLAAGTPELLAADKGDLWDTGRVESDQTIHVVYGGRKLKSGEQCYWKVRVWDRGGKPSSWSKPATWSMGLLRPEDWQAEWIAADAEPVHSEIREPHNGYHSHLTPNADTSKWVAVDLGRVQKIDGVRLWPARPFDYPDTPGFLFPVRFKIETATKADFSDAKKVVDRTKANAPNPGNDPLLLSFSPTEARYVRLTATRLRERDGGQYGMALAEMEVIANRTNLAKGAVATCLDSINTGAWSLARLVDGRRKADRGSKRVKQQPATMLRKEFTLPGKEIKRATAYVTALGLYELSINGRRIGDHLLAPEWTKYPARLQYQTYDVTDALRQGKNAVGATLSEGWYAGPLMTRPAVPEPVFRFLMHLDVELADGTRKTIVSDGSWQGTVDGPVRGSGIYYGETYDARREMPGWDKPDFDAKGWKPVRVVGADSGKLVAQPNEPIRVTQEIKPVKVTEPKPGVYIYDFGQNMVGWCRVKVSGPRGMKVKLRHGELVNRDGTLWQLNLGPAVQTDVYTLRGEGEEVYEPHFTYHGFRYLEVTGAPKAPSLDDVTGRVFRSSSPEVGRFKCSNDLLNAIMRLVIWVQRGNMHSVPTDCPQRSERFGWMGDIQSFSQTGIFNMDMAAFFTKWVVDIRDSQADDGRYSNFSPNPRDPNTGHCGVPAWADAGTIVPWRQYQNYADRRMMAEHFDSARRWVDFINRKNPNLLWQKNRGYDFNDWLNGDTIRVKGFPRTGSAVPKEVFATCFFAKSTEIVAKMAEVLGKKDEAAKYAKRAADIRKAFQKAYVDADGKILGDTQAGYALALRFNMVDEAMRPKLTRRLLEAIRRFKGHPSTGIQTSHRMMLELTRNGQHEEAYRLANLRTVPSWGYMVESGGTTIWERWDGYMSDRNPQSGAMNSFNHWAFGSVGEWIWRYLAGIQPDETQPGFKHFTIHPEPVGDLRWVKARYDSIRGPIESNWKIENGKLTLSVLVPANTTATVCVPTRDPDQVTEGGRPVKTSPGVRRAEKDELGTATFEVESGRYEFSAPW
jgi:alpha-L-rhamnosidase